MFYSNNRKKQVRLKIITVEEPEYSLTQNLSQIEEICLAIFTSVGEGVTGGLQPSLVGQLHSVNFPERTIGNSGNFSVCFPCRLTQSGRNFRVPLNLKPTYGYGYIRG